MSIVSAVKTGNWSDPTVWDTDPNLPASGDTVLCGAYVVTIDQDVDIGTGTLTCRSSGYFAVSTERNITANILSDVGHTGGGALRSTNAAGTTVTITGHAQAGPQIGIAHTGTGTVTVTSVAAGSSTSAHGISCSAGAVNVTTATGGTAGTTYGVSCTGTGSANVTVANAGTGATAHGVNTTSSGVVNVVLATGDIGVGVVCANAAATVNVTTAVGGQSGAGASNTAAGKVICDLAIGNDYGAGGTHSLAVAGIYGLNTAGQVTRVKQIQYGPHGQSPTVGAVLFTPDPPNNSARFTRYDTLDPVTLTDNSAAADLPAVANVRLGVSYNHGDLVGTAAIPSANQVAAGIAVDNTVGTAVLTAAAVIAAVWDEARSGHTVVGSFGNTSEWAGGGTPPTAEAIADQVRLELATELARVDVAVSSRNATTPPSAAANATAVRSELTTELGRIDVAVSSRNATTPLDSTATQAAAAAALSAYDPPTTTEFNARTLPSADYTIVSDLLVAPTVAEIADGVWNEALAEHAGAGSAGLALATASSGGVDPSVLADAIWDEALAGHSTVGTTGKKLADLANADLSGLATAADLATVDGIVDAILVDTGTTLDALIRDIPNTAEFDARTLPSADYVIVSDLPAAPDNASIAAILEDTGTTLPALIDNVPTGAELSSALAGADDAVLSAIAALNNLSSAQAQSAVEAALTAYDLPTKAEMDSAVSPLATAAALDAIDNLLDTEIGAIKAVTDKLDTALELDGAVHRYTANALELAPSGGGGSALTVAEIVDGVWDEAIIGHSVAGSTGQALSSAGGAADPLLNLVPGSYPSGTAGAAIGALGSGRITVVQPIISEGNIRIIKGDDYRAVDGRAIDISNDSWVSLTGGAVTWTINGEDFVGSVIGAQTVRLELTSAQTSLLTAGELEYSVVATLANGHKVTLVRSANASVLAVT